MKFTDRLFAKDYKFGWPAWAFSAAMLVFGLALLIWPGKTTGHILNIIGGILMATGAFHIIRYFSRSHQAGMYNMDLGIGITLAVLGLLLYIFKGFLLSLVPSIIGLFLLISGFIKLQAALDFRRLNVNKWNLQLVAACISLGLGLVILINPFRTALLLTRIIGAAIIVESVQDVLSLRAYRNVYNAHYTHFTD